MIYNGQDDIICNTPSTENWINKLEYDGAEMFRQATYNPWKVNNETVGTHKTSGNFTFVVVNKAGHMVPRDQMVNSKAMMMNWLFDREW